jgi:hypothetical protein
MSVRAVAREPSKPTFMSVVSLSWTSVPSPVAIASW